MKIGDVYYEKHTVIKTNGRSTECDVKEVNAIEIPDNATNGDVLMAMFPNLAERDLNRFINFTFDQTNCNSVEKSWWNAPYKKESED